MTENKNQNIYTSTRITYMVIECLPTSRFKWIDPKEFDLNKYTSNNPREYVLEVALEYPQELQELHSDDCLAPDKIEIKREMLPEH